MGGVCKIYKPYDPKIYQKVNFGPKNGPKPFQPLIRIGLKIDPFTVTTFEFPPEIDPYPLMEIGIPSNFEEI